MKLATTLAFLAAAILPAAYGQGLSLDHPADNDTVSVGHSVSFSWSTWPGENGEPAPTEAYFWISAFNVNGQNAWSIGPDGQMVRVDDSTEKQEVKPVDLTEGSLSVHIDYTDKLTGRADPRLACRIMITSGNMRDFTLVGQKGQVYVNRNVMLQGMSPNEEGVNQSLTATAESLLPVQTDENGAKYQHVKGADQHVDGTVDAKKNAAQRNGAVAGVLALVVGVVAAAAVVV